MLWTEYAASGSLTFIAMDCRHAWATISQSLTPSGTTCYIQSNSDAKALQLLLINAYIHSSTVCIRHKQKIMLYILLVRIELKSIHTIVDYSVSAWIQNHYLILIRVWSHVE